MIRLAVPPLEEDDLQAVRQALASGMLVQGPRVAAFEQAVARAVGTPHAVAVSSGTAALHAALLALGVGPGDLVLVTAYSWPATGNVIELCGAHPIFLDITPDCFNLDPGRLEDALRRLTGNAATARRLRAVLPVHAFGHVADMPAILELASRYDLRVVEDAACALGAALDGRPAGAWGTMGCFSFHPRKAVTTGEGGVVTTRDAELARRLCALRNHGLDPAAASPDFILPGLNYRLTEFQGALGLTQLAKLERVLAARRRLAAGYDALLQGTRVRPPVAALGARHVYQSYVVLLPEEAAPRRAEIIRALRERGIETTIGTWHMPLTSYFRSRYGHRPGDFPVTDAVFARSLTLPLHERLTPDEQARVVQALTSCLGP
jgi:dTDP-4-amino-4,6-dideoxygalactose transaminase